MRISVIIPTLNEALNVSELLPLLKHELKDVSHEDYLWVDADSSDNTARIAADLGAIALTELKKSRADQMNKGAVIAKGEILYFVHADSRPPTGFFSDILQAFSQGFDIGCFRFQFDSSSFLLKINSFFTRLDREMCRGGESKLCLLKDRILIA